MAGTTPILYLLSGLPCSGKTAHARQLESRGVIRVSVDDMMIAAHGRLGVDYEASTHIELLDPIVHQARDLVTGHLAGGSRVVLDHGLGRRDERDAWKQLAVAAGAKWELIRFDADMATLRARCALRSLSAESVPITDETLQALSAMWEPPTGERERCIDSTADWAQDFYSVTDRWWGDATAAIDAVDRARAGWIAELFGAPEGRSVLELGCGSGSTAAATAALGFAVTGIDFSDRIDRATTTANFVNVTFVNANFYDHNFDQRFDVVTYWDGFGVSSDAEHIVLLNRISRDLVRPDGLVVIEVFDPTGFEHDDGLIERKPADPQAGYPYTLDHARSFDPSTGRSVDAWKEADDDHIWSQSLRCYSPAEFADLVFKSELSLVEVLDAGRSDWSYIAVLQAQPF